MGITGGGIIGGIQLKREEGLLLVMDTPKGRGIFAGKDIPARTVLEVCPVLVLDPVENEKHIRKTNLYNYTYNWPYKCGNEKANGSIYTSEVPSTTQAVVLGLGSMFNHSSLHQNVGWERDLTNLLITYTTLRDIRTGEELCISYGSRLTFKDTEAEAIQERDDGEELLKSIELLD
ncbi:hypothetical protein B7463_g167, partial [Scytalidium lignicola]